MYSNFITLIILFISIPCIYSTQPQYIYTIQHLRSFSRDKFSSNLGCNHSHITYGTYVHAMGLKDALFVYLNQGTYQTYLNCQFKQIYAKIFGTEQDYSELLKNDPGTIAEQVRQMVSRINPHYVVEWKCPLEKETQKARNWLNTFVQKLSANAQVYVKAPASYFCYLVNSQRYLLDLGRVNNYIIEMYGQQPGLYTSYDEIFEKDHSTKDSTNNNHYSQTCSKYPALQTLVKNNPGKQFWIGKTILKEEAGYVGPKLGKYLERAGKIYEKPVFMDASPEQIIQL